MIYTTGTIAGNGSTITGTGTNFTAAGSLIRMGCTLIAFTNPVQVLQITAITSGTVLSVTPAISPAIAAGTKYAILLSDSLSVDGLAQDIAETFGMYQRNISGFADVMNGSGDVTITIDGKQVTVPGQKALAKRGENSDITSLSGLTTALSILQGGTGAKDVAGILANLGLKTAAQRDVGTAANQIPDMSSFTSGTGWCRYPDGTIFQYGTAGFQPGVNNQFVNLPRAFTTTTFRVICTWSDVGPNQGASDMQAAANVGIGAESKSTTRFGLWQGGPGGFNIDYIAIGR